MPEATAPLASRSPQSIAVDNLLRRELRIADPNDPAQIAQGLLSRYPDTLDQMRREREGINYGAPETIAPRPSDSVGASATELALAQDDLERDIATLTKSSELKEIDVELKGWGRAVRQAASDGLAAASMALDIVQSDRAMAARRVLGDYARMARYVGSLSADTSPYFRRFAQSCDVMASLILVGIGDGLAANGITRGTALIRVSASELQSRRNAVMQAFRTLTSTGLTPSGQDEYPRGLEAYRILTRQLEMAGQSDLRTLLDEASLASELDQLVDLAVGATSSGLRELTSTSSIVIDRLGRLADACRPSVLTPAGAVTSGYQTPASPPLIYFASALQLLVDAFVVTQGGRLLFIARPPILAYGLYGMAGPDPATDRLIRLAIVRGKIAEQSDCFACCGCDDGSIRRQVMLDFLLYRVDRAIDLYAVGYQSDGISEPEIRAASIKYTIDRANAKLFAQSQSPARQSLKTINEPLSDDITSAGAILAELFPLNAAGTIAPSPEQEDQMVTELNAQYYAEKSLERLVQSLSLRCFSKNFFGSKSGDSDVCEALKTAVGALNGSLQPAGTITIPPDISSSIAQIANRFPPQKHG
jgi:hypothetical protein